MTKISRIYRFDFIYGFMKIYLLFICLFIEVQAQDEKSSLLKNAKEPDYEKVFKEGDLPEECNADFKGRFCPETSRCSNGFELWLTTRPSFTTLLNAHL